MWPITAWTVSQRLAAHAEQIGACAIASIGPTFFRPAGVEQSVDFCAPVAAAASSLPFFEQLVSPMGEAQSSCQQMVHQ